MSEWEPGVIAAVVAFVTAVVTVLVSEVVRSFYQRRFHEFKLEACYFNRLQWREVPIRYRARLGETKLLGVWKIGFVNLFHMTKKRFIR